MRKILILVVIPLVALIATLVITRHLIPDEVVNLGPVQLGVITTLTGSEAAHGKRFFLGVELGVQRANEPADSDGQDEPDSLVAIYPMDDASDAERAKQVFRSLVGEHHVQAIIGPISVESTEATVGLAEEIGVVVLSPVAANVGGTNGRPGSTALTFHLWPSVEVTADSLARTAIEKFRAKRIAVLRAEAFPGGRPYEQALARTIGQRGGTIVASGTFPPEAKNAREILTPLAGQAPEVLIVLGAGSKEAVRIFADSRLAGLSIPVLADDSCYGEPLLEAGPLLEGFCFASMSLAPDEETGRLTKQFGQYFRGRHGEAPDAQVAAGYAAVDILVRAIGHGGRSTEEIARNLREGDWSTVFGRVRFDAEGRNVGAEYRLFRVTHDKRVVPTEP